MILGFASMLGGIQYVSRAVRTSCFSSMEAISETLSLMQVRTQRKSLCWMEGLCPMHSRLPASDTSSNFTMKETSFVAIFITIGQLIPLTHPSDAVLGWLSSVRQALQAEKTVENI